MANPGKWSEKGECLTGRRKCTGRLLLALGLAISSLTGFTQDSRPVWAAGAGAYSIMDLGVLSGTSSSSAAGINNAGDVVGTSGNSPWTTAFYWSPGTGMLSLGSNNSWATGINNAGSPQVAVTDGYPSASTSTGAEIWQNGVFTDPGTAGTSRSYADGINDTGWLVGQVYQNFCECAALWRSGTLTNLGSLDNAHSTAYGVNNAGQAVGGTETTLKDSLGNTLQHAFSWTQSGGMVDLTPDSTGNSSAAAINQAGIIVGEGNYSYATATSAAVMWQNGSMSVLGTLGGARASAAAINNAGSPQVVGSSYIAGGGQHAFLWQNGTMTDLNTLLPGGSGWVLTAATGVNDSGQIVGQGSINGANHAFLMTPITAPTATVSPTSLSFGSQNTGTTSAAQVVTLTNAGSVSLIVGSLSLTGSNAGDFKTGADACTGAPIAPGNSCTVQVSFAPTATGTRTGSLAIGDNASNSPQTVSLDGTGTAPAVSLSAASLSFGNQWVNTTSAAQKATVTNSGSGPLTFGTAPFTIGGSNPGDFSQTNTCGATLAAGSSCTVSVSFRPTASGPRSATLTISDTAADSPQRVSLSGFGLSADLGIGMTPSSTKVKNGAALTYTITVTNSGPGNASGVVVSDALPAGETFNSGSGCAAPPSGSSTATCSIGALANGGSATVSITVKVKTTSASLTNTASVSASTFDPNAANNSATSTVSVSQH